MFLSRRLTGKYASLWVSLLAILMTLAAASILLLAMAAAEAAC